MDDLLFDPRVIVSKDGVVKAVCANEDAAFVWLLTHQSCSVARALSTEGWTIKPISELVQQNP